MNIGNVDKVEVSCLVENSCNKRDFLAEHGLSFLIKTCKNTILFDTGYSGEVLQNNMKVMKEDFEDIDYVLLSHNHNDHTGGMCEVVDKLKKAKLIVHPKIFDDKYAKDKEGTFHQSGIRCRENIKDMLEIEFTTKPFLISEGIITSGEIPLVTSFENPPSKYFVKNGGEFVDDDLKEEEALIINVKDKGLVVISGCAHRGIINTIIQATKVTGINNIYAVISGFHLWKDNAKNIDDTVRELKHLNVKKIALCHCTGFKAATELSNNFENIKESGFFSVGNTVKI